MFKKRYLFLIVMLVLFITTAHGEEAIYKYLFEINNEKYTLEVYRFPDDYFMEFKNCILYMFKNPDWSRIVASYDLGETIAEVISLRSKDGTSTKAVPNSANAGFVTKDGSIFVTNMNGEFYCRDVKNGRMEEWKNGRMDGYMLALIFHGLAMLV